MLKELIKLCILTKQEGGAIWTNKFFSTLVLLFKAINTNFNSKPIFKPFHKPKLKPYFF